MQETPGPDLRERNTEETEPGRVTRAAELEERRVEELEFSRRLALGILFDQDRGLSNELTLGNLLEVVTQSRAIGARRVKLERLLRIVDQVLCEFPRKLARSSMKSDTCSRMKRSRE